MRHEEAAKRSLQWPALYLSLGADKVQKYVRDDKSPVACHLVTVAAGGGKFVLVEVRLSSIMKRAHIKSEAEQENALSLGDQYDAYMMTRATFVRQANRIVALLLPQLPDANCIEQAAHE